MALTKDLEEAVQSVRQNEKYEVGLYDITAGI